MFAFKWKAGRYSFLSPDQLLASKFPFSRQKNHSIWAMLTQIRMHQRPCFVQVCANCSYGHTAPPSLNSRDLVLPHRLRFSQPNPPAKCSFIGGHRSKWVLSLVPHNFGQGLLHVIQTTRPNHLGSNLREREIGLCLLQREHGLCPPQKPALAAIFRM